MLCVACIRLLIDTPVVVATKRPQKKRKVVHQRAEDAHDKELQGGDVQMPVFDDFAGVDYGAFRKSSCPMQCNFRN